MIVKPHSKMFGKRTVEVTFEEGEAENVNQLFKDSNDSDPQYNKTFLDIGTSVGEALSASFEAERALEPASYNLHLI